MTSITWAGPRCVQEAAAILGPQNRIQGRCELYFPARCHPVNTMLLSHSVRSPDALHGNCFNPQQQNTHSPVVTLVWGKLKYPLYVCALSCVVQYKHEIALFTRNIDQSIYNLNVNFKPTADFCCLKWISGVFAQNGHPMVKVWWFAVGGCYHILFVATKVFLQLIKVSTICDQIFSERVTQTSAHVTAS